jgi:hypothetical protein
LKLSGSLCEFGLLLCLLNDLAHLTGILARCDLGNKCFQAVLEINLISNTEEEERLESFGETGPDESKYLKDYPNEHLPNISLDI